MTKATVLFDISRLIWRAWNPVPTGIDRVELAYALYYLRQQDRPIRFVALNALGRIGLVGQADAGRFIERLNDLWQAGRSGTQRASHVRLMSVKLRLQSLIGIFDATIPRTSGMAPIYLLVSHHHLDRAAAIERFKTQFSARFICLVHDLIPLEYPEYARPNHDLRHARRMDTVATLAEGVLVNSTDTGVSLRRFIGKRQTDGSAPRKIAIRTAFLGTPEFPETVWPALPLTPYFLFISTIEPRKNHLMLLNLWRAMRSETEAAPRLILVGRRGWENENVIDMLERCPALKGYVEEYNDLPDHKLIELLRGARALLLPSFVEGYGLPLAEALAAGVPAICSGLPSLREIGGDVPEYLDPLDGPAWNEAIRAYTAEDSVRRSSQLERLAHWRAPNWTEHFAIADALIDETAQ